jgi:cytochrome d ubiquinol oxidase subunit I
VGDVQKVKLAAIEAEWETHEPPAPFTLFGIPDTKSQETHAAIRIPWLLGLIATRSVDEKVSGLKDLMAQHEQRIRSGIIAYGALQAIRDEKAGEAEKAQFEEHKADLGYGLLLKRYTEQVVDASEAEIEAATRDSIPNVGPLFWSFRVMVFTGVWMLFLFVSGFYLMARRRVERHPWLLKLFLFSIPAPWIGVETGWLVAEYGRQPWAIAEVLPTFLATSSLQASDIMISLTAFVLFYTLLAVIEMYLMFKFSRLGPSSLHTGRYHFEQSADGTATLATAPRRERQE